MDRCSACGAEAVGPLADQYEVEVRKVDADPERCARLAPPTSRASIHGFILGTLVWILILIPFFASDRARVRDTGLVAGAVVVWIFLFRGARRKDAALQAAYRARRRCGACGHEVLTPSAG